MCSIEETLKHKGKMSTYYRLYVDDKLRIMRDKVSADNFLQTLDHCHSSVTFTKETEKNGMLLFLNTQLLNKSTHTETIVYVKPTNSGLLLQYKSHVDDQYKYGLLKTMLDHAFRLSSNSSYFSEELSDQPDPVPTVLPFKDQATAYILQNQLTDWNQKVHTNT
ncbi:unnamed protein product [Porites evermanni]|uniref:Helix-turn-helix domain-containing protein n=1 Tax=Porites evermanni TaxID=104178 RepID=A0ABN8M988_9CNID|nr:unnamed protein product [Porites evermanni]